MARRIAALLSAGLRTVVMLILYVAVRLTWSVRVHGLEHVSRAPSTYFAITHKRDFDSMAPLPPVLLRRGWRAVFGEVRFAMRSDSFTRGFLARVVRRPRWFVRLLRPFSLALIVRGLGIMPLQEVRVRPLEEWMRECLPAARGDRAESVLTPSTLAELADAARMDARKVAALPFRRLFRWRFHPALIRYVGPDALAGDWRRTAERAAAARALRFLAEISGWLRQGRSIYSAPEGRLTPDGHLSPIISGFHRMLRDAPAATRVVPIAIVYDFMTTGRPRMFIDVAPAIEQAPTLAREELNERLRRAWMRAARYTCTQLASGYIVQARLKGHAAFTQAELAEAILRQAHALRDAGRAVDARLLTRHGAQRRVRRYLDCAARTGYVERAPGGVWRLREFSLELDVPHGETGYRTAPLSYAWNELQDMGLPRVQSAAAPSTELTA